MENSKTPNTSQQQDPDPAPAQVIGFHRCQNGHLLGRIVKTGRATRLELFPHAVAAGELIPLKLATVAHAPEIVCTICGSVKAWHADQETLERLLDRVTVRNREKS